MLKASFTKEQHFIVKRLIEYFGGGVEKSRTQHKVVLIHYDYPSVKLNKKHSCVVIVCLN